MPDTDALDTAEIIHHVTGAAAALAGCVDLPAERSSFSWADEVWAEDVVVRGRRDVRDWGTVAVVAEWDHVLGAGVRISVPHGGYLADVEFGLGGHQIRVIEGIGIADAYHLAMALQVPHTSDCPLAVPVRRLAEVLAEQGTRTNAPVTGEE